MKKNIIFVDNNYIDIGLIETISDYEIIKPLLCYSDDMDSIAYGISFNITLVTKKKPIVVTNKIRYEDVFFDEKELLDYFKNSNESLFYMKIAKNEIQPFMNENFNGLNFTKQYNFNTPDYIKWNRIEGNNALVDLLRDDLKEKFDKHVQKSIDEYNELVHYWSENNTNGVKRFFMNKNK